MQSCFDQRCNAQVKAIYAEQKQIIEDSIFLATAEQSSEDAYIMHQTLDACLLRMLQYQLIKCA